MQPLQPGAPHPNGCPFLRAGDELQARADAESDAGGTAGCLDRRCQYLLPRRAHREEHETRGMRQHEFHRRPHRHRIALEALRWIVVCRRRQPAPLNQRRQPARRQAQNGDPLTWRQVPRQQQRGQVLTGLVMQLA